MSALDDAARGWVDRYFADAIVETNTGTLAAIMWRAAAAYILEQAKAAAWTYQIRWDGMTPVVELNVRLATLEEICGEKK